MTNRILTLVLSTTLALGAFGAPAQAACYADYKAKMDNPLRLHYGVAQVPEAACSVGAAFSVLAPRVASGGWELLEIMSVFNDAGLASRRADAGQYYLRF